MIFLPIILIPLLIGIVFILIGIFIFSTEFKKFTQKRRIENIPTTTIRGISMGLVEIKGRAESKYILKSPLTNTPCVFFEYLVAYKVGSYCEILDYGDSFDFPFYINDDTGRVLVDPKNADVFFYPIMFSVQDLVKLKPVLGKIFLM